VCHCVGATRRILDLGPSLTFTVSPFSVHHCVIVSFVPAAECFLDHRLLEPQLQGHGGILMGDYKTVHLEKYQVLKTILRPNFGLR